VKLPNWESNLEKYLYNCKDRGFSWGNWDCLKFVNGAVKAQRNVGFANDWFGSYSTPRGAALNYARITRHGIYNNIIEGLDDRLSRCSLAEVGSIVAIKSDGEVLGYSLGIKVDSRTAFVGEKGLILFNLNRYMAWSVK
tara:strand:- start:1464 stop:1880 length:417 start_codon:yes stop_codon:yes gene_type:complete